jgi:hypothetical protein
MGQAEGREQVWYRQADPAPDFIRRLQKYLSLPATGVWDRATHDAFYTAMATIASVLGQELPLPWREWGTGTDALAETLDTMFETEAFPYTQGILQALGLPTEGIGQYEAFTEENREQLGAALRSVIGTIAAAERGETPENGNGLVPSTPPEDAAKKTNWWLIGGLAVGGLAIAGLIIWLATRKKNAPVEGYRDDLFGL